MTDARDIKWDRGSIEELKRWLLTDPDQEDVHEETSQLDYPWPISVSAQQITWTSLNNAKIQASLAFDAISNAEDYEVRLTIVPEVTLPPAGWTSRLTNSQIVALASEVAALSGWTPDDVAYDSMSPIDATRALVQLEATSFSNDSFARVVGIYTFGVGLGPLALIYSFTGTRTSYALNRSFREIQQVSTTRAAILSMISGTSPDECHLVLVDTTGTTPVVKSSLSISGYAVNDWSTMGLAPCVGDTIMVLETGLSSSGYTAAAVLHGFSYAGDTLAHGNTVTTTINADSWNNYQPIAALANGSGVVVDRNAAPVTSNALKPGVANEITASAGMITVTGTNITLPGVGAMLQSGQDGIACSRDGKIQYISLYDSSTGHVLGITSLAAGYASLANSTFDITAAGWTPGETPPRVVPLDSLQGNIYVVRDLASFGFWGSTDPTIWDASRTAGFTSDSTYLQNNNIAMTNAYLVYSSGSIYEAARV